MLNPFDRRGQLRTDFSDEETRQIAALEPLPRQALDKLIATAKNTQIAEAALKTEEISLKQAVANQAEAAREVARVTPKRTHHDLYLHQVKHIEPAPPSDAQLAAEAAVDATAETLAIARDAVDAARQAVKDGRSAFATALSTWQNNGQPIPTALDVQRSMTAKFKPTPKPQRPQYLSEIDRVAAAGGGALDARQRGQHFRRGAEGKRSYPAALRGQRLPGYVKG
jgi:hypothetical protein